MAWTTLWEALLDFWETYTENMWLSSSGDLYVAVKNENYGYAVTTHGNYVGVGNPSLIRYSTLTPTEYRTGSVDVFRYNVNTDTHALVETLYRPFDPTKEILLAAETSDILHTETLGYDIINRDKDLAVNFQDYLTRFESDYGRSIDFYQKRLAIGCRYYWDQITIDGYIFDASGSCVDVWDYTYADKNNFTVPNPEPDLTASFGHAVSLNTDWLAVGSPHSGSDYGKVYLYRNQCTGSTLSWSLYQTLESPSGSIGEKFGWSLSLNKCIECRVPNRLIVGVGSKTDQAAYAFEYSNSLWVGSYYFQPQSLPTAPLTFDSLVTPIVDSGSYTSGSFGFSVSTYDDTVVIGAPTDRQIFEYTNSSQYEQGAVYIYKTCGVSTNYCGYQLVQKYYGDEHILKNNRLGWSVSVYGNNLLAGSPKTNIESLTSCFVEGSLGQQDNCGTNLEDMLNGQWVYFTRNTSSLDWEFSNVFQKKKRFMSPYRSLGAAVGVGDKSIVIGAPMMLTDSNRNINVEFLAVDSTDLGEIAGKAYVYNLNNYKDTFYVGNVFYRNGKIVINTSGSAFEGLYFNPTTPYTYEYSLDYQSKHVLYEKHIVCTVDPGEFNVSTNPTAVVKATSSFDLNANGMFDFQDADILLRYMQYKNTVLTGSAIFNWSSSVVRSDDEKSYYEYNASLWHNTDSLFSSSFTRFETTDAWIATLLDFNQDNKTDINDMNILWKYVSNRLTQRNYSTYINSNCRRQNYSDVVTYLNDLSKRNAVPEINTGFTTYDAQYALDKTGSFLSPFVTTIGLYNGLDLVAVAKLGSPIKLPRDLPINFVVKLDF